jgi:hypothetical protein
MAIKSRNSAEIEKPSESSKELFPELAKKPSAASSSGIRQTDLIMQQGRRWYESNIQINDSRDTLTDEENLQAELNLALENSEYTDNQQYLKSVFEQINTGIITPALNNFNDSTLTHLQKARLAKRTQGEILKYLRQFYANEYRQHISIGTLEECLLVIGPPDWKNLNCLIKAQNSLKLLLQ